MAQIDFQDGRDAGNYRAAETRLDIRHMFLILMMASLPVIPMPIAGGTPILVGAMFIIYATLTTFPHQAAYLDRGDQLYIYLGFSLFLWEALSLAAHASNSDALFVLGRGLWIGLAIAIIMAMNTLYARAGMKPVTWVLVLSLLALLAAMVIEVNFYPKRLSGRDFGLFAIPFPRFSLPLRRRYMCGRPCLRRTSRRKIDR